MNFFTVLMRYASEKTDSSVWIDQYLYLYKNKTMRVWLNPAYPSENDYIILYDNIMYKFTPEFKSKFQWTPYIHEECILLLESQLKAQ